MNLFKQYRKMILESPYLHDGHFAWSGNSDVTTYSASTIERQWTIIKQTTNRGEQFMFIHSKVSPKEYCVVTPLNERFKIVAHLKFKDRPTFHIHGKNILQVDAVRMEDGLQGMGLISELYSTIIHQGYVVASDAAQFEPGKMLWKKLAKEARQHGLKVHLFNGDELLMKSGKAVEYDGSNVPDTQIWSSGHDFSKFSTVLIVSS